MKDTEVYEELINELIINMEQMDDGRRIRPSKKDKIKSKIHFSLYKMYLSIFCKKESKDFSKERKIKEYKVACILDEFSYNCFSSELDLYPLKKEKYIKQLNEINPDILFVESAWNSYEGGWAIAHQLDEVKKLLLYCKRKGIITIFWNKEDPVHFYDFIKKAVNFDYIFTTDEQSIENYKKYTNKDNVFSLMFAAEPKIHNPIKDKNIERCDKSVFAGTFYRNKYPDRLKVLMEIMYVAKDYGLDIYDRNYLRNNVNYRYPNMYQKNIVGNLPYEEINKAYKGYKINININSVTDSTTMFSRRVFEVLACNTPVVSNYSKGIEENFGDIVQMGKNHDDFVKIYDRLYNDNDYYEDITIRGVREVLSKHTYKDRVEEMFSKIGIQFIKEIKNVLVIGMPNNNEEANKIINSYEKQKYPNKDLIIFSAKNIKTKYRTFNDIRKIFAMLKNYDYISIMSSNDFYGENYLLDLMLADKYLDGESFIGKSSFYILKDEEKVLENPGDEYQFIDNLDLNIGILKSETIKNIKELDDYLKGKLKIKKGKSFSIDKHGYIKDGMINNSNIKRKAVV